MVLGMIIGYTIIMLATTIAIYEAFRNSRLMGWFIYVIDSTPITQFLLNFGISMVIMTFTGSGSYAGIANLAASIIFPFYCVVRNAINPNYTKLDGKKMQRKLKYR